MSKVTFAAGWHKDMTNNKKEGIKFPFSQEKVNRIKLLDRQIKYFQFLLDNKIEAIPRITMSGAHFDNGMFSCNTLHPIIKLSPLSKEGEKAYTLLIAQMKAEKRRILSQSS